MCVCIYIYIYIVLLYFIDTALNLISYFVCMLLGSSLLYSGCYRFLCVTDNCMY